MTALNGQINDDVDVAYVLLIIWMIFPVLWEIFGMLQGRDEIVGLSRVRWEMVCGNQKGEDILRCAASQCNTWT